MMIRPRRGVLAADQSQALRDQRIAQLNNLKSTDEAADWVHKNLPAKNTLTFADAKLIEDVFQKRLAAIGEERPDSAPCPAADSPLEEPSPMQGQAFDGPEMPGLPMAVVRLQLQQRPFVCGTRSTANSSPRSPASSAAASLLKRITFALLNPAHSIAKLAMSTRSQSAASIIASCTNTVTRSRGGLG
jgi:hypothetical protein